MTDRRELPFEPKLIRAKLQERCLDVLDRLGFGGEKIDTMGRMWPLNPMRADRKAGSFVIYTRGEAAGGFKDYAVDAMKGSIFDLIMETQRLESWIEAYWWALDFLNLDRRALRSATQADLDRKRAERDRLAEAARARKIADDKSRALFTNWRTLAPIAGTVAEIYLREARGIPLDRWRHLPGALRFDPALDHFDDATGEVTTWPAMVSAMTLGTRVVAVHRTWLAPDGSGKAPVARAKKMTGPISGAAIRLTAGSARLSPSKAAEAGKLGPLSIGEGIETSLTVAAACPEYRVWAAGSLSLIGLLDWPDCASAVVLLRDNDWKPEAQVAFDRVAARWRAMSAGRPVHIVASAVGSDFNDWRAA